MKKENKTKQKTKCKKYGWFRPKHIFTMDDSAPISFNHDREMSLVYVYCGVENTSTGSELPFKLGLSKNL